MLVRLGTVAACVGLMLGLAGRAGAVPINFATSGTATASTELGACCGSGTPFFATRANDGSRDGSSNTVIFHSNTVATPAFWQVDMGTNRFLDRVEIFPRTNANQLSVENFRLDVFNASGATVFSKNYLVTDSTRDTNWGTNDIRNVVGSRVRITRNDAAPDFMTFGEVEVFAQNTPIGANLAFNKTVTANLPAGFGAQNSDGVDGDINGHFSVADTNAIGSAGPVYHNNTAGVGNFWQVDLGSRQFLDYVNLFSRSDGGTTGSVTLDIFDDGNLVTPVFSQTLSLTGTDLGASRFDQTVDFANRFGRYVRVTTNGNQFLAFAELEAFAALPEPASWLAFALVGFAGGGYGVMRRRRLAKKAS